MHLAVPHALLTLRLHHCTAFPAIYSTVTSIGHVYTYVYYDYTSFPVNLEVIFS